MPINTNGKERCGRELRPPCQLKFAQAKNIPDPTTQNFSRDANGLSHDPVNVESGNTLPKCEAISV